MRLSTSTNIYFNRPNGTKAGIEDSIRRCAAAGYQVMDLNFHDCTTFKLPFVGNEHKKWIDNVAETALSCGVVFSQAHSPFYNFCDEHSDNREYIDSLIRRAIDHCSFLGIPWIVIHAGTDFSAVCRTSSSKAKNLEYFKPLVEYAQNRGVGIAVENLWDLNISPKRRYTAEVEELIDFVSMFPADSVGVCYDVGHGTIMDQNHAQNLRLIGNRLKATHISDCIDKNNDHILPYSGKTDWNAVIHTLKEIDYQGDFTYEIHRYTANMPDSIIQKALEYSIQIGQHLINL